MTQQIQKERPILFSGEMVRAILEGRKTQTRRAVKGTALSILDSGTKVDVDFCPYGNPGDRLWVRETWGYEYGGGYLYKASHSHMTPGDNRWRPSIHMPRAACRIILEITDVRVERLKDISEADAKSEGIEGRYHPDDPTIWTWRNYDHKERFSYGTSVYPKSVFRKLWQSINGPDSWDKNPFVWAITFKKIEQ